MAAYWFDLGEGVVPLSISQTNMRISPRQQNSFDKYDEIRLHMEQLLSASILDIEIPMRIAIPLDNAGIRRLRHLVVLDKNDLLKVNRLGEKAVDDVEKILHRFGLSLNMSI